jgi:hypothetical protein
MANLGRKGSLYIARFRFQGKEYKKSLKTTDLADATAAMHAIERTIHHMTVGTLQIPPDVDPGDFIVSGGTLEAALKPRTRLPTLSALIDEYLAGQAHKAPSSVYTEGVHLRNLKKKLPEKLNLPADRVTQRDLERYIQERLKERSPSTGTRNDPRSSSSSDGRSPTPA